MKKKILLFVTTFLLASSTITSYAAGWGHDDGGYWYLYENNSYAREQIITIDGANYGFNKQAYMITGWYSFDSNWYYFSPDSGIQVLGWLQLDGKWFYLNPGNRGIMQKGWLDEGKDRYYFDASGVMATGEFDVDGYAYFAESNGKLKRSTTDKAGSVTIRYDQDGKQWYKNEESELNRQLNNGDTWLPILAGDALLEQRKGVVADNEEAIAELKYDLYEDFKNDISKSKSDKGKNNRITKWKEKANRRLTKLSVPQYEIDEYISTVIDATYNGDRGKWSHTYTEQNADGSTTTYTYTYWGSYNYNYDYDDDWDDDFYDDDDNW